MEKTAQFSASRISIEGGTIGTVLLAAEKEETEKGIPLVYINGGPGGTYLDENHGIKDLAVDRDVVLYDQLGSYHSPAPFDMSLTPMPRFVEELKSVLDAHHFEKAIILGHSFGASIAVDFALAYPERLAAVIFSSPLLSTKRWIEDANILLAQMPDAERDIIQKGLSGQKIENDVYAAAEKVFYDRHLCRLSPWPARLLESFSKGNKEIYRAMWGRSEFTCSGTLKDYDRFPDLHKLKMPVLLVCGRYDEARPETMQEACALMPHARLEIMENASHCPLFEDKDAYISALSRFAAEADKAA